MAEQIWVVRAGRDAAYLSEFIEKSMVAIGWGELGDLTNVHGRAAIDTLLREHFPGYTKFQQMANVGQISRFRDELTTDATVLTYEPDRRVYHVGVISGDYIYRPEAPTELKHTRPVRWTTTINRDDLTASTKNSLGSISTIFCISQAASDEIERVLHGSKPPLDRDVDSEQTIQVESVEIVRKNTEQSAFDFLQDRLSQLSWDDMQEIVAGLLRAMGLKTRVSPPGSDRGIDILASPDGFGLQSPRILVEVKHRKGSMGAPEIRNFAAVLRQNDSGLYVSTGGFSKEARYEAARTNHPLALMDSVELGKAVVDHYDKMDAEARALPLKKIYWPI